MTLIKGKVLQVKRYKNGKIKLFLGKKIIGMVHIQNLHKPCAYILDFVVRERYRNSKYGTHLLCNAVQEAIEAGCECVKLHVWEKNEAAIRLYRREGFFVYATKIKNSERKNYHLMVKRTDNLSVNHIKQ